MLTILLIIGPTPGAAIPAWAFGLGLCVCVGAVVALSVVKRGRKP